MSSRAALPTPYADYPDNIEGRNRFIDDYIVIKNLQFRNYVMALRRGTSYGGLAADGSRLVLDGLAATTGGASVKAGLAAASAGITGFTGAVRKEVLFDQALPSFIAKMEELRANKLADITLKRSLPTSVYSRGAALIDIEDYGACGTFDAALSALNVQTGRAAANATMEVAVARGDAVTAAAASPETPKATIASRVQEMMKRRSTPSSFRPARQEVDESGKRKSTSPSSSTTSSSASTVVSGGAPAGTPAAVSLPRAGREVDSTSEGEIQTTTLDH